MFMKGDKHKPINSFSRWIENFQDGIYKTNKKGGQRVPSIDPDNKRYERRWRRRQGKKEAQIDVATKTVSKTAEP